MNAVVRGLYLQMAMRKSPDLSLPALVRLVAGMTKKEVEAVVGCFHRPNLYQGRRYYAWMAKGGMLRAFFDGPGGTLSQAVLHVQEGPRLLNLSGDFRARLQRCTVKRAWSGVSCRKSYRRSALPPFVCPLSQVECDHVPL
jgi:hypothetical protein